MEDQGDLFTPRRRKACPTCGRPWPSPPKRDWTHEDRGLHVETARLLVLSDIPLKYNTSLASLVSAHINKPVRVNQRQVALAYWMKVRRATWDEVAVATGIPPKNSSRMTELEELGLLGRTGELRKTQFGGVGEVMECLVESHAQA